MKSCLKSINVKRIKYWLIALCYVSFLIHFFAYETVYYFNINSSIFSILFSAHIVFCLSFLIIKKSNTSWVLFFGLLCLLISTNGRAGWLGFLVAVFYVIYNTHPNKFNLKKYLGLCLLLVGVAISSIFFIKRNSTSGRFLIYKTSLNILKNNWVTGIGYGKFKVQYNLAQANYFVNNNIDSKEAFLADNTYYAFNDYLQFIIEFGFLGIVLLGILLAIIFLQISLTPKIVKYKTLYVGCNGALISIAVGAMFSYPMQHYIIQLCTLTSLLIVATIIIKQQILSKLKLVCYKMYSLLLLGLIIFITGLFCFKQIFSLKKQEAYNLQKIGYNTDALLLHKQLANSKMADGELFYTYAQSLYITNKLADAKIMLQKSQVLVTFNGQYILAANIENELKNYTKAEQYFKTAIYMVPNRMVSRKNLLDFYVQQKDTPNALLWANSILNMPIKVPSTITDNIKNTTQKIYNALIVNKNEF